MLIIRLAVFAGWAAVVCTAAPILTLLPGTSISGAPGSMIGWGYSIQNDSSTNWLQPTNLSAGSFAGLSPSAIFDYPAIAPGQTVSELFSTTTLTAGCVALPCGLYELTIPAGHAPVVVTGTFILQADYFNGDPNGTGVDTGSAPNLTASYSASVLAGTVTPEPGTLALVGVGSLALAVASRRRQES